MTDSESKRPLLPEDQFLIISGLSEKALREYEKSNFIKPTKQTDGTNYYSEESAELAKAMAMCQGGRCANLQEAYQMALQRISLKDKRNKQASEFIEGEKVQKELMDPKNIKTHVLFEEALLRSEDLLAEITNDMALSGYRPSEPIALATWPGLEDPVVYDGHTRRLAAIATGISRVPVVIEDFDSVAAVLEEFAKSQILRRPNDQGVRFRLFELVDSPQERGGDRRSEQAKSKPPNGGIEKGRSPSAQRTADSVGWSVRMVERARRVRDQGTPEILEAVRSNKMSLGKAEKAIADQAKETSEAKSSVKENQNSMVQLTDENLAALKELGGNLHSLVNRAVREFVARHREKDERKDHRGEPGEPENETRESVPTDDESAGQES